MSAIESGSDDASRRSPGSVGRGLAEAVISAERGRSLDEIHSETTRDERRLIHAFMRDVWTGGGAVLEVGTYLGGTTRALGLGMADNPAVQARSLVSCDRFSGYHHPQRLIQESGPLWRKSPLAAKIEGDLAAGRWRALFDVLHAGQPYSAFLRTIETALPDLPEKPAPAELDQAIEAAGPLSVLFIDGCKSWYSTKWLFRAAIDQLIPGGWVIAQDYGRYTTHWIPSFLETFADHFEAFASADDTYVFRYRGGLNAGTISGRFPDSASGYPAKRFDELFGSLYRRAAAWNDLRAALVFGVQHAGALATAGHKDRAREILRRIVATPAFAPFEEITASALLTPTFTPEGPVSLAPASAGPAPASAKDAAPDPVACNICGGVRFGPGPGGRMNRGRPPCCLECESLERQRGMRAMYHALQPVVMGLRAFQFTPDRSVPASWFASYASAPFEDYRETLERGAEPYGLIIANHTLHKTPDDQDFVRRCFDALEPAGVLHLCLSSPLYRWATRDFEAVRGDGALRDYGADFAIRISSYVEGLAAMVATVVDPVTGSPDLVGFFSRSAETLERLALPLERVPVSVVRVA